MKTKPICKFANFLLSLALLCAGCSRFKVTQQDWSRYETNGTNVVEQRVITTSIEGSAHFSSAQTITGIKALQTDKTQSFGAKEFGQQGATNIVNFMQSLARVLEAAAVAAAKP